MSALVSPAQLCAAHMREAHAKGSAQERRTRSRAVRIGRARMQEHGEAGSLIGDG